MAVFTFMTFITLAENCNTPLIAWPMLGHSRNMRILTVLSAPPGFRPTTDYLLVAVGTPS